MTAQLSLPTCCLPGCKSMVEVWGQACRPCLIEWGPYLAPADRRPGVTDEDLAAVFAERDRGTMAAYAAQAAVVVR